VFNCLLLGTSNWSEDYFVSTAGVGLIINQNHTDCRSGESSSPEVNDVTPSPCPPEQDTVQAQLAAIFDRDWNSAYAHPLPKWCLCWLFQAVMLGHNRFVKPVSDSSLKLISDSADKSST